MSDHVTHETHEFNLELTTAGTAAARRRARILHAASKLFAERPYALVQMDDIAHLAGVAKPTVYRYFSGKEKLFLETVHDTMGDIADVARTAAALAPTRTGALLDVIEVAAQRIGGGATALRALDGADPGLGQAIRKSLRAASDELREIVNEIVTVGIAEGEFRDVDPAAVSLLVLGAVRMAGVRTPVKKRAAMAATMGRLLLHGLADGRTSASSRQTETT